MQDVRSRELATAELSPTEVDELRALLLAAFIDDGEGGFGEDDWQHALGGVHFVLDVGGRIVSHAAVVERELHIAGRPHRTGYVEAVATAPDAQRRGYGSTVMRAASAHIARDFELGALGTGSHGFYERLDWRTWRGPSSVRTHDAERLTPDDDGHIMVLRTSASPDLDLDAPISCAWRPGDVW